MRVDVWTDIICPWCYIGKRRLERALADFEGATRVSIAWHSYELDPSAPRRHPGTADDLLVSKYGRTPAQARAMHDRLTALAAEDGLEYRFDLAKPGNSHDAHRLLKFATTRALGDAMLERLMRGYFSEGVGVSDQEGLHGLAVEVGLPAEETRQLLEGDDFSAEVRADQRQARELGLGGVPAFVFDEKYLVSGAQPSAVFGEVLLRASR